MTMWKFAPRSMRTTSATAARNSPTRMPQARGRRNPGATARRRNRVTERRRPHRLSLSVSLGFSSSLRSILLALMFREASIAAANQHLPETGRLAAHNMHDTSRWRADLVERSLQLGGVITDENKGSTAEVVRICQRVGPEIVLAVPISHCQAHGIGGGMS